MSEETTQVSPRPRAKEEHHLRTLMPQLKAAGTFEPAGGYHAVWAVVILGLYLGSYAVLLLDPGWAPRIFAIVVAAIMMMQFGLFAHEVGHGAVTTHMRLRAALGLLSNSLLVGFSYSYWQSSHSVHHNHPNVEGLDPDMESAGYALYERAARRPGFARMVARTQPVSLLLGFLLWAGGIKLDGMIYLARHRGRRTALDAALVATHFVLWLAVPMLVLSPWTVLLNYAGITVLNGIYMGAILVVPHVGTGSVATDRKLPFFTRQVQYSRNYNSSWIGTLLCGGLNLQIEHHLLPHIPCVRLRRARPIIAGYCAEHALPYEQMSYWGAWGRVFDHLRAMARIADGGESRDGAPALDKAAGEDRADSEPSTRRAA